MAATDITVSLLIPPTVHRALVEIAAARMVEAGRPVSLANLAREAIRQHYGVDLPDAAPPGRQRQNPPARVRTRSASPVAA